MAALVAALGMLALAATGAVARDAASAVRTVSDSGQLLIGSASGEFAPAPVLGSFIAYEVTGPLALGTLTQVFSNPRTTPVEAVYRFPLPDGAVLDTVRLTVGDRTLEGLVMRTEEAITDYEAARGEGRRAALVEQSDDNIFRTQVANIAAGETVEVALTFRQVVRFRDGAFRLRIPLVAAALYRPSHGLPAHESVLPGGPAGASPRVPADGTINPVALRVTLAPGWPIAELRSPTHTLAVDKLADDRFVVELADQIVSADGDLVLEWVPDRAAPPTSFFLEDDGNDVFALIQVVTPRAPSGASAIRLPRETIFVLDTSGSMEGTLGQAVEALARSIHDLDPGDRFNVIRFASDVTSVFSEAQPASIDRTEEALRYLLGLEAKGGTEIGLALKRALAGTVDDRLRQVVFFTDGAVSNTDSLLAMIRARLGSTRLFTVGIGSAPNAHFMRRAAEVGRGSYTFVDHAGNLGAAIDGLSARLATPSIVDLEVDWDDPNADGQPATVRDLYADETVVLVAKLTRAPREVVLRGSLAGHPWEARFDPARARRATGIGKLWAERKVESLGDAMFEGVDPQATAVAITEIGLAFQIATPYTSLLVVDHEQLVGGGDDVPRVAVPLVASPRSAPRTRLSSYVGGELEETITVSAASPLLDERQLSKGTTVSQMEIDGLPVFDLWSSAGWAASVETSPARQTASTTVSSLATSLVTTATPTAEASFTSDSVLKLDGVELTDWSSPTLSRALLPLRHSASELMAVTGGADVEQGTPGLQIDLRTHRGTNAVRGHAHALGRLGSRTDDTRRVRVDDQREGALEAGGPLIRDRLWAWGSVGRLDRTQRAIGDAVEDARSDTVYGRLHAQPSDALSTSLLAGTFDAQQQGQGAGPLRTAGALVDTKEQLQTGRLTGTYVFHSSLYLDGALEAVQHETEGQPRGRGPRTVDDLGREDGAAAGLDATRERSGGELGGNWFTTTGRVNHELRVGGRWLESDEKSLLTAPGGGQIVLAGGPLGLPDSDAALVRARDGQASAHARRAGLWLGDQLAVGRITASAGLRYDDQTLEGDRWDGPRWRGLSPRLSMTAALGEDRRTLLRVGLGRFRSRLGTDLAWLFDPDGPRATLGRFVDTSGDLVLDAPEVPSLVPWTTIGFDPRDPSAAPADVDMGWAGPTTDELTFAAEHSLGWSTVLRLEGVLRTVDDTRADRRLVRDSAGVLRPETAADYELATGLVGTLPSGRAYEVPVFDLRPGLEASGRVLVGGSDRQYRYRRLSLGIERRLSNRWSARGHLTWSVGRWRIGQAFRDRHDPTADAAIGDRAGDLLSADTAGAPGWSLLLASVVQLPRGVRLAAMVQGREGDPLVYSRSFARPRAGIVRTQLAEARAASRLDDVLTVDLRAGKEMTLKGRRFIWSVEVFNLFDQETVTARNTDLGLGSAAAALATVPARVVRAGLSVAWR